VKHGGRTGSRLALLPVALLVGALAAGCGGARSSTATRAHTSSKPKPSSEVAARKVTGEAAGHGCLPVPSALAHAILAHVVLEQARLTKIRAATDDETPGYYYVSGTLSGSGARDLLATWATHDLGGGKPIYSVDANAAMVSQYGASTNLSLSLDIAAPGAYRSRVCVAGKNAPPGAPAPQGGTGAPAGQ